MRSIQYVSFWHVVIDVQQCAFTQAVQVLSLEDGGHDVPVEPPDPGAPPEPGAPPVPLLEEQAASQLSFPQVT